MCGIAGAINWGDKASLCRMVQSLVHRGPDDEGIWETHFSGNGWVGLGHRRLSILDLSKAGHQPMSGANGRFWIAYNGEIYNYQELRQELLALGCKFKSQTDTEVILHLYEKYGPGCVEKLRGMFVFGIWDCEREELFLVRDRLGVKPLYYAEKDRRLLFASEMKALLKNSGISKQINAQALDAYLTYLYVPPPQTIFSDIQSLLPGHYLVWRKGHIAEHKRYWALPKDTIEGDEASLVQRTRDVLEESVKLRMVSDVPVGAFLSGGVDSSSIVGLMAQHSQHPIKTFSIGFGERAHLYNELDYARRVSEFFDTDHHELIVEPDVVSLLPKMVEGFDQPFGNPTALLVYTLAEFTRKHVTVALAGDGGDEVFGGYPRYKGAALSHWYRKIPAALRKISFEPIVSMLPESSRGRHGLRRLREFVKGSALPPEEMYCDWVTYFSEDMKAELYASSQTFEEDLFFRRLFEDARSRGRNTFFDQITAVDLQSFLPYNLLAYTDRMSMAHSLEVRVPFTDHKLVEQTTQLKHTLRLNGVNDKYILREAVRDLVPEFVLKRGKLGFNPPMALWLQEDLDELVKDCLSDSTIRARGYFRPESIRSLLSLHASGKRDLSLHIWALLVFETWHRMYIDS